MRNVAKRISIRPDTDHRQLQTILQEHADALTQAADGRLSEYVSITGTYSSGLNDHIILVTPAAATTVTLPAAKDMRNKRIVIKRSTSSTTYGITVQASSGNIDGAASTTINTSYASVEVFSDGTAYWKV